MKSIILAAIFLFPVFCYAEYLPPAVSLKANGGQYEITAPYGVPVTLEWASSYSNNCVAAGDWAGVKPVCGSETVLPKNPRNVYLLSCGLVKGFRSEVQVVVNVAEPEPIVPPAPVPTVAKVEIVANGSLGPVIIPYNTSVVLAWHSLGTTFCEASGDWYGEKPVNGEETTPKLTNDAIFNITCSGPDSQASSSVMVKIEQPAYTSVSLTANGSHGPLTIEEGSPIILNWNSLNATMCYATGLWLDDKPLNGSETIGQAEDSGTYTIVCEGPGGTASDYVEVDVIPLIAAYQTNNLPMTPYVQPTYTPMYNPQMYNQPMVYDMPAYQMTQTPYYSQNYAPIIAKYASVNLSPTPTNKPNVDYPYQQPYQQPYQNPTNTPTGIADDIFNISKSFFLPLLLSTILVIPLLRRRRPAYQKSELQKKVDEIRKRLG